MAAILQARPTALQVAPKPFVARLPADAVALAQFGSRIETALVVRDEPFTLFHGGCLRPGHRPTSPLGLVPKVDPLSPINPDKCVTNLPGLYRARSIQESLIKSVLHK